MSDLMVRFPCPKCGRRLKAPRDKARSRATCTTCGERMLVPGTPAGTSTNGTSKNGAAGNDSPAEVFAFGAAAAAAAYGNEPAETFDFTTAAPAVPAGPVAAMPVAAIPVAPAPADTFSDLCLTPEPPSAAHWENADQPPLRWSVALIAAACGLLLALG